MDTGLPMGSTELDVRDGYNCISPGKPAQDDNGHGTSIGGVVGARANGSATVGVAPGTPLHAIKVLNARSSGTLSQLLCGLDWLVANAVARNIRVVNMSISAVGADDGNYGEVLAVTATTDTDGAPGGLGPAPTCVRGEGDDQPATFSNYATTPAAVAHTVAAPGVCVQSTGLKSATSTYYGTSSAAPHAAAVAALCIDDAGTPGPCAELGPAGMIAQLAGDGLTGAAGFAGDPSSAADGRHFGPLVTAEAY
jgi:subtilisin family serine protease